MELNKIATTHLYLLGFTDELTNFTLTMNNPSSQIEAMELENLQKRIQIAQTALQDTGNGMPIYSVHRTLREIMKMSDKEIADNINEIRLEKALSAELEKIGVKFAFETHPKYINDTPEATKKLVDLIDSPAVGINMDYGNTIYFPVRPSVEEAIDIYGDKLFYIHLKNSSSIPGTKTRIPTNLSDGEINHRAYLEKLHEVGFCGPICIEAPRSGDRVWYAKCDYEYYKAIAGYR